MWEKGHSFDEIDNMSIQDFGDVVGYWAEMQQAEAKMARQRANKPKTR